MALLLTSLTLVFLLWGKLPPLPLLTFSLLLFALAFLLKRKASPQGGLLAIDFHAQHSNLRPWPEGLKILFSLLSLTLVLVASTPLVSFYFLVATTFLTLALGKTPPTVYFSLFLLPLTFICLSLLAIMWSLNPEPTAILSVPPHKPFLFLTPQGQKEAFLIFHRGLASCSCLFFLALSTPISQLLSAGESVKLPATLLSLMVLIYTYIFLLLDSYYAMTMAAASRLGFKNSLQQIKTQLSLSRNLFFTSLTKSSRHFDALESRCFSGEIRFLSPKNKLSLPQISLFFLLLLAGLGLMKGGPFLELITAGLL